MTPGPGLIVRGLSIESRIQHRRTLAGTPTSYTFCGYLHKIVFDPSGMDLPAVDYPVVNRNLLQWLEEDPRNCPRLAISKDEQDLLILGRLPQPPDLPGDVTDMSDYVDTDLPGWASRGGRMPRRYPQRYSDRTRCVFGGHDEWLVIQPVYQIMLYPFAGRQFQFVRPGPDPEGRLMSFMVNPKTQEAHFIGGSLLIDSRIHRA